MNHMNHSGAWTSRSDRSRLASLHNIHSLTLGLPSHSQCQSMSFNTNMVEQPCYKYLKDYFAGCWIQHSIIVTETNRIARPPLHIETCSLPRMEITYLLCPETIFSACNDACHYAGWVIYINSCLPQFPLSESPPNLGPLQSISCRYPRIRYPSSYVTLCSRFLCVKVV